MSEDRRITFRGSFCDLVEAAAQRRFMSTASFITAVVGEYLRTCGELLNEVKDTSVTATPKRTVFDEAVLAEWGDD